MNKQNFDINNLRVASPCPMSWENMTGDERVRLCHSCKLNIYNVGEMTKPEVENLIATHEGRLCIRLYKRADGTVLTKDCPVGFRAYQKRVAHFAGATLATLLSLFSISFGQKEDKISLAHSKLNIVRIQNDNKETSFSGNIKDPAGALVPGVEILLRKKGEKQKKTISDEEGNYSFLNLSEGIYSLEFKASGFKTYKIKKLKIQSEENIQINISLEVSNERVTVGIFTQEPLIDTTSSSNTTTITREMIEKIPR